jgi:hypothetical protein
MKTNSYLNALRETRARELAGAGAGKIAPRAVFGFTKFPKRAAKGGSRVIRPQNWGVRGSF